MKNFRRFSISLACLLLACSQMFAQGPILRISELPRMQRDTVDLPSGGLPIVDINSQLVIRPDPEAIRAAGRARFPQFFQDDLLEGKAARIEQALANQDRIVELTQKMVEGLDVKKDLLKELETYLQNLAADSVLSEDFNTYTTEFFQRFRSVPREQRPNRFLYSIERFNEQLEEISGNLKTLRQNSQLQFSVAAWRRDPSGGARIHVENFDRFENGAFSPVPRWVTTLSENDRAQLENFQQLAQGLNTDARQVLQAYKDKVLETFPSIQCVQEIRSELDSAIRLAGADLRTVLEQFKSGATEQVIPIFTALRGDLRNWTPTETPGWKGRLLDVLGKLDATSASLQAAVGDSILRANRHLTNVNQCLQVTLTDMQRIQNLVQQFPYAYLHKLQLNSEDLAEEILAFHLNDIPPEGIIDLEYSGQRRVGDEILIKAVFRVPNDSSENKNTGHPIEVRRIKMVLVGAHSTTKVGLIMANPYTMEAAAGQPDPPKFRFAPSAALLLKFGSRRWHFYNNFLDPGIGLNSAAPDFDLDGTPEFSAGIMGTIFRDILSIGWNWNFGLDRPNYFIGIHLPFNLPGVPVNTIQNNPLPEN